MLYTRSKISTIAGAGLHGIRRHWMALTIPIAILLVIAYTIAFLIDEPLRRYTETKVNRALKGYTARIGKLNFHPLGFALDLDDVVVTQDEHPEPAVIRLERLSASVHWRALLSGKLVADIELAYFAPNANRSHPWVDNDVLTANGHVEYGLEVKTVSLARATIDGIKVDYVHTAPTAGAEREVRQKAATAAKQASNAPDLVVRITELQLARSTIGFVNKAATPAYRVFISNTDGTLTNLGNQEAEGTAGAKLKGAFMGSGTATAEATFKAEKSGPAFDIGVRVEEVDVTTLNELFRAYGRFDTSAGRFFLYSELAANDGVITGYVKPLFKDLKIYSKEQDQSKPAVRKMYEHVVGGIAKRLKNRQGEEGATKAEVLGRIDNPRVSTVDAVVKLVQNAFFKAILPGFDLELSRVGRTAEK